MKYRDKESKAVVGVRDAPEGTYNGWDTLVTYPDKGEWRGNKAQFGNRFEVVDEDPQAAARASMESAALALGIEGAGNLTDDALMAAIAAVKKPLKGKKPKEDA
jgi:hypothetical protein